MLKLTNSIKIGGGSGGNSQTPIVEMTSTIATLETGKFYKWGEVSILNISFATPQSDKLSIYAFKFTSGETAATLTINGTVTWITGETTLEANKTYEINICDGLGVMACACV